MCVDVIVILVRLKSVVVLNWLEAFNFNIVRVILSEVVKLFDSTKGYLS